MTEGPGQGPVLQPASAEFPLDPTDFGSGLGQDLVDFEPEQDEGDEVEKDIDEHVRDDFHGLMVLGYLEDECEVVGHRFLLKTPSHDERIERGMLHKPYVGSMNFEPMWELITVAAYVHRIDSVDAPEPLGPKGNAVGTRLDWVKRSIYSSLVISKLFGQTIELDARERAVVDYLDDQGKSLASPER